MKTLTTKRLFAYMAYSKLKGTAPKDYPEVSEMMTTVDEILPALEKVCGEFITFRDRAQEINDGVATNRIVQEIGIEKMKELQKDVRAYELSGGREEVTTEFENAAFGLFNKQFDRWAKTWFDTLDDFIEFQKDITKANLSS